MNISLEDTKPSEKLHRVKEINNKDVSEDRITALFRVKR
jgi:hypothetical protein